QQLKREANLWRSVKHEHVVPFIGVCDDISRWPCLISPLYKHGHVGNFLRKNPTVNRETLVLGVASGLEYLHDRDVIHGDLKVANVLVDKHGVPRIGDFGISKILNRRGFTTLSVGTPPYMAPELFYVLNNPEKQVHPTTTKSSDVYSFGLLALEILTSEPPRGRPARQFIIAEQIPGLRPKRADYERYVKVPETTWAKLDQCWEVEPDDRPTISELRLQLSAAFNDTTPGRNI
ncbi:kinase-like domain-containing protein, partial [Mycena metata]